MVRILLCFNRIKHEGLDMANLNSDLLYGFDDRPPLPGAILKASQHMLASFVEIMTPTLIIDGVFHSGKENGSSFCEIDSNCTKKMNNVNTLNEGM